MFPRPIAGASAGLLDMLLCTLKRNLLHYTNGACDVAWYASFHRRVSSEVPKVWANSANSRGAQNTIGTSNLFATFFRLWATCELRTPVPVFFFLEPADVFFYPSITEGGSRIQLSKSSEGSQSPAGAQSGNWSYFEPSEPKTSPVPTQDIMLRSLCFTTLPCLQSSGKSSLRACGEYFQPMCRPLKAC